MSATWQWAKANPDAAAGRIRELERENEQQAQLLGKGSEREARLLGRVGELQHKNAALRAAAVEACALARVWATVWGDKLSAESIQRFAELEKQILKEAQP